MTRSTSTHSLMHLISEHKPGFGLAGPFYTDPDIFDHDLKQVFRRHWHCVCHQSIIPNAGDFEKFDLGGESILITRNKDGEVHALLNVCRHRGASVCAEQRGNRRVFVCPYHAWSYSSDGALRGAREMPKGFDHAAYGLKTLAVEVVEGLVFVNFSAKPIGFETARRILTDSLGQHGWDDAKVAHREQYRIAGNWKLAVENYVECYHCGPAHPEYAVVHAQGVNPLADSRTAESLREVSSALGLDIKEEDKWHGSETGQEAVRSFRYAMLAGALSGTRDGTAAAPLMGRFTDYDGGVTSVHVGGTSFFITYADYGIIYRFSPKSAEETDMELIWLVRKDAEDGKDFDTAELSWLWHVTSKEDKEIIELAAAGVRSDFFEPGPVAPMEPYQRAYREWYLNEARGHNSTVLAGDTTGQLADTTA